jgi:hypothetical protein
MSCQTCEELLAACERSVKDHMNFVLGVVGASGDDAHLASQEAARMAQNCKETLEDFKEHRRRDHTDLAGEAG